MSTATAPAILSTLFEQAAKRHPDAAAIEDPEGRRLTYRQLDELAGRMAHRLADLGVTRGDRVGISMPKSINSVVAILGILKARAAYVPTDHASPPERNRYIFENCETRAVVLDEPRAGRLYGDGGGPPALIVPGEATAGVGAPWLADADPAYRSPSPAAEDDLAYILYTSGSTGLPKGVMHTHASASSFVHWAARTLAPSGADRFSSHAPFHFDLSILDLYVPMTAGASIVLVGEDLGKDPHRLAAYIAERRISVWYSVPSILALMAQYGRLGELDFSPLHTVCFAGEVFPVKHLRALVAQWPGKRYFNLYGPTETNVCTYLELPGTIDPRRQAPFPIGIPCENVRALVLDDGDPVADGEEGVLYIHASGPVMAGYWGMPERTAASFRTDPGGERWYCTGDVVKLDADGNYDFIGRRDRMVKRRGYRIELGEIEAGLYKHPDVREAAAIAGGSDEGVEVVVYLSARGDAKLSIIALKQHCMRHLPAYMIPDRFSFLPELPRTSTDKVDYQALVRGG